MRRPVGGPELQEAKLRRRREARHAEMGVAGQQRSGRDEEVANRAASRLVVRETENRDQRIGGGQVGDFQGGHPGRIDRVEPDDVAECVGVDLAGVGDQLAGRVVGRRREQAGGP